MVMDTTLLAAECARTLAPEASAELFERIFGRIHGYFLRLLGDPHAADDCLQETLILLQRSLREGKYDSSHSFNTWIWLKARSVYGLYCRRAERRPGALPEVLPCPDDEQARVERRLDAETLLKEVARRLGPETYEVFVLYYDSGLTQAEVSAIVGRDPKTIRGRIAQARELLDRLVANQGEGE